MKFKIAALILLTALLFCMTSCNDQPDITQTRPEQTAAPDVTVTPTALLTPTPAEEDEHMLIESALECIYDNMFFYQSNVRYNGDIYCKRIDDVTAEGKPVFCNENGEGDNPLEKCNDKIFLVDREATAKNNNVPVLIVAFQTPFDIENIDKERPFQLASYNLATNELTVISDCLGQGSCGRFYLYGDTIYYFMSRETAAGGYNTKLYSINKNGENLKELCSDFEYVPEIIGIHNNKIYYFGVTSNTVTAVDMDFKNPTVFMIQDYGFPSPFIADGYIYYYDDYEEYSADGLWRTSYSMYRRSVDMYKQSKPELLLSGITESRANSEIVLYSSKGDMIKTTEKYGSYLEPSAIRVYDIESNTKRKLPNIESSPIYGYYIPVGSFFMMYDKNHDCYFYNLSEECLYSFPELNSGQYYE